MSELIVSSESKLPTIIIDKEFQSLIPPLTKDEYDGLEQSIVNEDAGTRWLFGITFWWTGIIGMKSARTIAYSIRQSSVSLAIGTKRNCG